MAEARELRFDLEDTQAKLVETLGEKEGLAAALEEAEARVEGAAQQASHLADELSAAQVWPRA